nr:retrovirus-related Pol polyprotein from transposon TNT 1-94 [Tanacetum cinerariifolium]
MKKKQQVKIDEAYARKLHEELNQDIDWDVVIYHVKQKAKEDPYVQRYRVVKKRPQTEAQVRRNMIVYLKNTAGFRLDYFKGMFYDDIRLIFEAKFNSNIEFLLKTNEQIEEEENRAIESINETLAQKVTKRRKMNEDVKDLKQHLEIVHDEDNDVYTKATPLARKVLVVDYQIIHLNNKPRYKIIRADGTHQLAMFGRPDGQDQVWKSQRKEVSSNDNEMVEVKVLMALGEGNVVISKEGAINGEWVKISMRKCDIRNPIGYLDSGCSRHMTSVKSYLHKYVEQPGPKVMFGDDSTCTTKGYGSIKCNGIVFTKVAFVNGLKYNLISISQLCDAKYIVQFDKKKGTIFNSNKEFVMIAPRVRDVYVLDMKSSAQESCFFFKASDNLNWLCVNNKRSLTKEIQKSGRMK